MIISLLAKVIQIIKVLQIFKKIYLKKMIVLIWFKKMMKKRHCLKNLKDKKKKMIWKEV